MGVAGFPEIDFVGLRLGRIRLLVLTVVAVHSVRARCPALMTPDLGLTGVQKSYLVVFYWPLTVQLSFYWYFFFFRAVFVFAVQVVDSAVAAVARLQNLVLLH